MNLQIDPKKRPNNKLKQIDDQITLLKHQLSAATEQRKDSIGKLMYTCVCGQKHQIRNVDAVRSEWYESPSGCMDGDMWHDGEAFILCPDNPEVATRILFSHKYGETNPVEKYFDWVICPLFKSYNRKPDTKFKPRWANSFEFEIDALRFGYQPK
jgi:hypothetical protein